MRPGSNAFSIAGKQRGAAMMIFVLLLVMGGLTYLLSGLSSEGFRSRREQETQEALTRAKEALIGYALQYRDKQAAKDADASGDDDRTMYGYLPLPDLGSSRNNNNDPNCRDAGGNFLEGCDAANFTGNVFDANGIGPSVVGRFPWRTLGTGPLRDSHGECLWLIVSSLHSRIQRSSPSPILPPMNWDTLGQLDVVVANGSNSLASTLASVHDRPVAVIFSPGPPLPGQDRSNSTTDLVDQCGGNYDAANYLDPKSVATLGGVTNSLAGTNNASGATGDSNPANDPDTPKSLSVHGKVFASAGVLLPSTCPGSDCALAANDVGMTLTADTLFGSVRRSSYFRTDINAMLDRMAFCLRDEIAAGTFPSPLAIDGYTPPADKSAGRISDNACYDANQHPLGYFDHYKEMIFVAKPNSGNFTVNGNTCDGVLLFSGQRDKTNLRCPTTSPIDVQKRITSGSGGDKNNLCNYLEGNNLSSLSLPGTTFGTVGGPTLLDRSPPQPPEQDIVRCIPAGAAFTPTVSAPLTNAGFGQIVAYDAATSTLTLGAENVTTDAGAPASALFGCAWLADARTLGSGLRTYFNFQFKKIGTSVGTNGFVFAIADALNNTLVNCGAAGSHLGYSGDNGSTANIAPPKVGIEFDQSRNFAPPTGYSENADPTLSGRNDPPGSHAAIVYWGHDAVSTTDHVSLPDFDDNVHGFPTPDSVVGAPTPPPRNPAYPSSGIDFKDLRGAPDDSRLFHIRVEVAAVEPSVKLAAARTATGGNINLATPGAAFGGVTLAVGDRVLVNAQSFAAENGVYVWLGPTTPMTRASDADSGAELTQAAISVTQGVNAESDWLQSLTVATVATDPQNWQPFVRKFRTEVWVHSDATAVNQIAAIKNVTRPMGLLYPGYAPTLTDAATMYAVPAAACVNRTCPNGQTCGADNICYRPPLKSVQVGFTGSQNTSDQQVNIREFFTTWLP